MLDPSDIDMLKKMLPQSSHVEIFPNVALTIDYHATFGELLLATLLIVLISLMVTIFLHNLILKKSG